MTTKEKIKQYLEIKGISKNKFYSITGLSTSFLDSGKSIGVDKAKIIIEKFPDISIDWLIMDRGEMLVSQTKISEPMPEIFRQILKEKDDKIEQLIADTVELKIENRELKKMFATSENFANISNTKKNQISENL